MEPGTRYCPLCGNRTIRKYALECPACNEPVVTAGPVEPVEIVETLMPPSAPPRFEAEKEIVLARLKEPLVEYEPKATPKAKKSHHKGSY